MNGPSARVLFQCPACRALSNTGALVVDESGARAGLACEACGVTTWLPLLPHGQASVGPEVSPAGGAPLPLVVGAAPPGAPAQSEAAAAHPSAPGGPFSPETLARIKARLARMKRGAGDRAIGDAFERVLSCWTDEAEHKQFLQKAATLGLLAEAGQRYRVVLDEQPTDEVARKAQSQVLTLAMTTLKHTRDLGAPGHERQRSGGQVALAGAVILLLLLGLGVAMTRVLRVSAGEAMIGETRD